MLRLNSTDIPQVECPFLQVVDVLRSDHAACTAFAVVWALTQELSVISGLDSLVNPDFVVINTPLNGPIAPLFLRFCC